MPGVALVVLAVGAAVWVPLAARGATVVREPGPATVVEDEPYPLRVELRSGLLPPPGGELLEPLLGWPVPVRGPLVAAACGSTCASPAAAGACSSPAGS